jgi:hypothetical protein
MNGKRIGPSLNPKHKTKEPKQEQKMLKSQKLSVQE